MRDRIIWGIIAAIILIIVTLSEKTVLSVAYVILALIAIAELWHLIFKTNSKISFHNKILIFIGASIFVAACFFCILLLRHIDDYGESRAFDTGALIVWLAFVGAFSTDTFAYIFGTWLGKNKNHFIFPHISPKKTLEGSIGGVIGTTILFFLWGIIGNWILNNFINTNLHFNIIKITILGFLCSFVAQLGDLSMSWLKRKFGVKDFGSILPGHGGILDRCDSLLLVAPFVLLFQMLFSVIS